MRMNSLFLLSYFLKLDLFLKKKEFYGILTAYDADTVTIEMEDESTMTFQKSDLALIRLAFDF